MAIPRTRLHSAFEAKPSHAASHDGSPALQSHTHCWCSPQAPPNAFGSSPTAARASGRHLSAAHASHSLSLAERGRLTSTFLQVPFLVEPPNLDPPEVVVEASIPTTGPVPLLHAT